jgi:hypothetical protein
MSVGGSPSVDSLQLWILTAVVEGPWYFPVLTSAERFARQSNYRIPLVDGSTLVDAVEGLLSADLLMAEWHNRRVPWENRARIESWIGAEPFTVDTVHFALTPEGGAFWERTCNADWSRYLNGSGPCSTIDVVGEEFTSWMHYEGATWSRVTEYARLSEIAFWHTRLRARTRELRPWKATYWKTLPSGFRLSSKYRYGTEESKAIWLANWRTPQPVRSELWGFTRWYQDPP